MEQNNENQQQLSFMQKLDSDDVVTLSSDFLISFIYLIFIFLCLFVNRTTDSDIIKILNTFLIIYTLYPLKGLAHSLLVAYDKNNTYVGSLFLSTLTLILDICYYLIIFLTYFIFANMSEDRIVNNIYKSSVIFYLIFIGFIHFAQFCLIAIMLIIIFPIMVYYCLSDPNAFYEKYGMDPNLIKNIPSVKADNKHTGACAICTDDIKEGEDIIILNCPGNHYFHDSCIKQWLLQKIQCPVCRNANILDIK